MTDKYRVSIPYYWPDWWDNFLRHCDSISNTNGWNIKTVINRQLKPHGKFIDSKTYGAYILWDDPKYHTEFLLRWA